jgi:hypothetical protein
MIVVCFVDKNHTTSQTMGDPIYHTLKLRLIPEPNRWLKGLAFSPISFYTLDTLLNSPQIPPGPVHVNFPKIIC